MIKNKYKKTIVVLLGCMMLCAGMAVAAKNSASSQDAAPSITITNATNELAGSNQELTEGNGILTWEVTNTGNVALSNIQVINEQVSDIVCPRSTLAIGESMACGSHSAIGINPLRTMGCATGDHVVRSDAGVVVTTMGDCEKGV